VRKTVATIQYWLLCDEVSRGGQQSLRQQLSFFVLLHLNDMFILATCDAKF